MRLFGAVIFTSLGLGLFAQSAMATYAHIQVVKINQGGNPSDVFTFHPTFTWTGQLPPEATAPSGSDFTLKGGEASPVFDVACDLSARAPDHVDQCAEHYSNVTLKVAELPTPGYTLTDITCRYTQSDDNVNAFSAGPPNASSPTKPASEVITDLAAGTVSLHVHYNEWVACYFTNTAPAVTPPVENSAVAAASSKPQIAVKPIRVRPGTARLSGPSGCPTADVVVARVTGKRIVRVTFSVDGKTVKTLTRPNRGSNWTLSVRLKGLKHGVHRVKARVQFAKDSQTAPKTMPLSFSRCGSGATKPQFTG
jgi:hypothetical protein